MDQFFEGFTWKTLKNEKLRYEIAHRLLTRITGHGFYFFIDDDNNLIYDPFGVFKNLSDAEKEYMFEINSGNDHKMRTKGLYNFKKISSAVGGVNSTEVVYASTFVPFDSSF